MKWFNSLKLSNRILIATGLLLVTVVTVNYIVFLTNFQSSAQQAMVERAAWFTAAADEAKNHVGRLNELQTFDSKKLLDEVAQARRDGRPYDQTAIFDTLPIVAGWKSAEIAAQRENAQFRITAFNARNPDNQPQRNSFEEKLMTDLTEQVNAGGDETLARVDPATDTLHFVRAIRLTADCMMCHGDPANSPTGDGRDILGFPMEGWTAGRVHGAYHVLMPNQPMRADVRSFLIGGLMWTLPLVIAGAGFFFWLLNTVFSRPVNALIGRLRDIAEGEGDLTQRVEVNNNDEIGLLGTNFNRFVTRIHDVVAEVSGVTYEVAGAATEIAASSEELAAGMREQTQQMDEIARSIESMAHSAGEVATQSEETANMASQAGQIAREGGDVVKQAIEGMAAISQTVTNASESVEELGRRGAQIGQIIEVINDIADQTNLLALNAAIEAARAGEHGRGFAVVADEVRKLADRTTLATREVADSIEAVQTETTQAVNRMKAGSQEVERGVERTGQAGENLVQIVSNSDRISQMVQSIAMAADNQSQSAAQINQSIETIVAVTRQSDEATSQSATAAAQLSSKAEQLQRIVSIFKTNARHHQPHDAAVAPNAGHDKLKEAAKNFRK